MHRSPISVGLCKLLEIVEKAQHFTFWILNVTAFAQTGIV